MALSFLKVLKDTDHFFHHFHGINSLATLLVFGERVGTHQTYCVREQSRIGMRAVGLSPQGICSMTAQHTSADGSTSVSSRLAGVMIVWN